MKFIENRPRSQFHYLKEGVLELCRADTIKLRRIEHSGFFLLDHNGQTQSYRLVLGQSDACLWRNHDFPTEDDDLEKCAFKLGWTAKIKPRQIERSGFFYWTTTDKLEFTDWSQVNRMFSCGEIVIFWHRMMFVPTPAPALTRVKGLNLSNKFNEERETFDYIYYQAF